MQLLKGLLLGAKTITYLLVGFLGFTFLVLLVYVVVCFIDAETSPAKYRVVLNPQAVKQGETLQVEFKSFYRVKACSISRTVRLLTANNRIYVFMKETNPVDLGVIENFSIPLPIPEDAAIGLARFTMTTKSQCPNNIVQYFWPTTRVINKNFNIIGK